MELTPLLWLALIGCAALKDPSPGLTRSKLESQDLACERLSVEAGRDRYPGQIPAARPRGDFADRNVVVCRERLMRRGLRPALDEAILSTLNDRAAELALATASLRPDLAERTWLVEAYYPSAPVTAKIAFATKNALMGRGLRVSDRAPTLAAGDIDVITRLPPDEAYPAACYRYYATGSLGEGDALLAVVSRDPRDTALHAGLCSEGHWTWLR